MSVRLLDLPDALRDEGVEPVVVDGFKTRGADFPALPKLHLVHWTAGPRIGKTPSLGTVTNGRPDLPYNLCTVLQSREGGTRPDKAYCVSSGRAVHAGVGIWEGISSGNTNGTANEIEWSGPGEDFPGNRRETAVRIAAAHLKLQKSQAKYCCNHREYAKPDGRKIDTNLDGGLLRADVGVQMQGGDDMDAVERAALLECQRLLKALVPRSPRNVMLNGDEIGKVVPEGIPGSAAASDLWRWGLSLAPLTLDAIAEAVVDALPPSGGGSGASPAQVEDAVRKVLSEGLWTYTADQ